MPATWFRLRRQPGSARAGASLLSSGASATALGGRTSPRRPKDLVPALPATRSACEGASLLTPPPVFRYRLRPGHQHVLRITRADSLRRDMNLVPALP